MSRQTIAKDIDLKIISEILKVLAEGHETERSRTFLEIKDANGRAFRYASVKNWPDESKKCINGKVEVRNIDEAFGNMSDKGRPRSNLHAILEDDEDGQEKENEEEEEEGAEEHEEEGQEEGAGSMSRRGGGRR